MKPFNDLLTVINKLLSPEGCPWDREQTLSSMRTSLLEEAYELVEAIDSNDHEHIEEELGDFLFIAIFLCRLAEKESKCSLDSTLIRLNEKLISRHPHVFENASISTTEEVLEQWEKIKKGEKGKEARKSAIDGIPKGLPALARAQKVIKKMRKSNYSHGNEECLENDAELIFGVKLFNLLREASHSGVDAENALRKVLALEETKFRTFESLQG